MTPSRTPVAAAVVRAYRRAATAADHLDQRHRRRAPQALTPGHPGVVPTVWAVVRLAGIGLAGPVLGPLVTSSAARNTRAAHALARRYPQIVEDVAAGRRPAYGTSRVGRVSAGARWFVSSDLHRCIPGTVDWPAHQRTNALYEVALGHYADGGWGLIENGDVEDFWLVGGSTYGVVYDLARLAGHLVRGATGRQIRTDISIDHLRRIVAHNRGLYDLIDARFHRPGRYHRIVGNHDDVYLDQALVDALGDVHAGVVVDDFIALDADGSGSGVGAVSYTHLTLPTNREV